jgi:hypothetical protein
MQVLWQDEKTDICAEGVFFEGELKVIVDNLNLRRFAIWLRFVLATST